MRSKSLSGKNKTKHKQSGHDAKPPAPIEPVAPPTKTNVEVSEAQHAATKAAEQPRQPKQHRLPVWIQAWSPIVLNALLLVVIAGHAFYFQKQWDAMKAALKETRISREIENRAWVTFQSAGISTLTVGKPVSVITIFVNSGRTPAYKFVTGGRVEIRSVNDPVPDPMPIQLIRYNSGKGILSAANGTYHLTGAVDEVLDQETLDSINSGQKRVYVWGQITYEDIFQNPRWLKFCLVNKAGTSDFAPCPNNNEGN